MATGRVTGITNPGVFEASSNSSVTSLLCGSDPAGGEFRVLSLFINSASGTINTPAGLTKVYDSTVDGGPSLTSRNAVFFCWDNLADITFTWSGSGWACVMSNQWDGVDRVDPFLLPPSAATAAGGANGSSLSIPSMVPPDGSGVGVWYWGMYRTSGSNNAITHPAALASGGYGGKLSGNGYRARSGFWGLESGAYPGLQTPNPTGAQAATTASSGSGAWRGIGLVLRSKTRGRFLPAASAMAA